jgi:hypothetical protein
MINESVSERRYYESMVENSVYPAATRIDEVYGSKFKPMFYYNPRKNAKTAKEKVALRVAEGMNKRFKRNGIPSSWFSSYVSGFTFEGDIFKRVHGENIGDQKTANSYNLLEYRNIYIWSVKKDIKAAFVSFWMNFFIMILVAIVGCTCFLALTGVLENMFVMPGSFIPHEFSIYFRLEEILGTFAASIFAVLMNVSCILAILICILVNSILKLFNLTTMVVDGNDGYLVFGLFIFITLVFVLAILNYLKDKRMRNRDKFMRNSHPLIKNGLIMGFISALGTIAFDLKYRHIEDFKMLVDVSTTFGRDYESQDNIQMIFTTVYFGIPLIFYLIIALVAFISAFIGMVYSICDGLDKYLSLYFFKSWTNEWLQWEKDRGNMINN